MMGYLLQEGDGFALEVPHYMQLLGVPRSLGADVRKFTLRQEDGWEPDWEEFEKAVNPGTRLVYVSNPNNPTGSVLSVSAMERIVRRCEEMDAYLEKYDHPLWVKHGDYAEGSGHGGMDFFVDHAFVEIVKRKLEAPLDAYDAAAWSAITPLSELSIENNGEPQDFPDFTRGRWMKRKPVFALGDDF